MIPKIYAECDLRCVTPVHDEMIGIAFNSGNETIRVKVKVSEALDIGHLTRDHSIMRRSQPCSSQCEATSFYISMRHLKKENERLLKEIRKNERNRDALIISNARNLTQGHSRKRNVELYSCLFGCGAGTAFKRCKQLGLDPDNFKTSYNDMMKFLDA